MGAVNLKKPRPHIERALHTVAAATATSYALRAIFYFLKPEDGRGEIQRPVG
jgi:hypothetical protein